MFSKILRFLHDVYNWYMRKLYSRENSCLSWWNIQWLENMHAQLMRKRRSTVNELYVFRKRSNVKDVSNVLMIRVIRFRCPVWKKIIFIHNLFWLKYILEVAEVRHCGLESALTFDGTGVGSRVLVVVADQGIDIASVSLRFFHFGF